MKLLVDNQLFICVNGIKDSIKKESIVVEQFTPYQKEKFLNRYVIVGANGPIHLSIPLLGGRHQHVAIKEVKICNAERWQLNHWKSIQSAYNRSPWFEYYKDSLFLLFTKSYNFLYDFNWACWQWCLQQLKYDIVLEETKSWQKNYPEYEFLDRRGPGFTLKNWGNAISSNNQEGIKLVKYTQVFEDKIGFTYNVSMLDLLFCEGPNALVILHVD